MVQQQLLRDSILEALKDDIDALGGLKVVGLKLWPDKECPIKAGKHLANCLIEDRAERLTPEQVMYVIREARKAGSFCTIAYICDDANMTRPQPIEPDDVKVQLQREVVNAANTFKQLVERLERVSK